MSDEKMNILGRAERSRLSADITYLMLKGAGYAAIFCLALWLVIAVIAGIGRALPPESRDASDPTPWSALTVPVTVITV
ncbi:RC-LH1 core complex protein PufX [Yoonia sp. R2331]|uniref:RC-LH1 core complex protein PufX n=1 Tax=Yoonia sp. R2331 TaxID=3237238 RepID=UPI0034E60920